MLLIVPCANYYVICNNMDTLNVSKGFLIPFLQNLTSWWDSKWHSQKTFPAPWGIENALVWGFLGEPDMPNASRMSSTVYTLYPLSLLCTSAGVGMVYLSRLIAVFKGLGSKQTPRKPFLLFSYHQITDPVRWTINWWNDVLLFQSFQCFFQFGFLCTRYSPCRLHHGCFVSMWYSLSYSPRPETRPWNLP